MSYTKFIEEQVFANPDVNVQCNLIYDWLIAGFEIATIEANVAMINTLAEIIDGAPLKELPVITLGIKNPEIYVKVEKELAIDIGATSVSLTDRVQMVWLGVFFEFWNKPDMVIKTVNGLQIEDLT